MAIFLDDYFTGWLFFQNDLFTGWLLFWMTILVDRYSTKLLSYWMAILLDDYSIGWLFYVLTSRKVTKDVCLFFVS